MRSDDLGPMRATCRDVLLDPGMTGRRSGWPLEMVLRARHLGRRVRFEYCERSARSKVTEAVKGVVLALQDIGRILRETRWRGQMIAK